MAGDALKSGTYAHAARTSTLATLLSGVSEVVRPCVLKLAAVITFGVLESRRGDGLRHDLVGAEQLGETVLGEGLAAGELGPWLFWVFAQSRHYGCGMHAVRCRICVEQRFDIGQETNAGSAVVGLAFDLDGGCSCLIAPIFGARAQVGDRQHDAPVVRPPIIETVRHSRRGDAQRVLVI